jgi:hypothetical protein
MPYAPQEVKGLDDDDDDDYDDTIVTVCQDIQAVFIDSLHSEHWFVLQHCLKIIEPIVLYKSLNEYMSFNTAVIVGCRLSKRHGGLQCLYLLMYCTISQAQFYM